MVILTERTFFLSECDLQIYGIKSESSNVNGQLSSTIHRTWVISSIFHSHLRVVRRLSVYWTRSRRTGVSWPPRFARDKSIPLNIPSNAMSTLLRLHIGYMFCSFDTKRNSFTYYSCIRTRKPWQYTKTSSPLKNTETLGQSFFSTYPTLFMRCLSWLRSAQSISLCEGQPTVDRKMSLHLLAKDWARNHKHRIFDVVSTTVDPLKLWLSPHCWNRFLIGFRGFQPIIY